MGYIYKIENNLNGKLYIGKTEKINPYERWKEHLASRKRTSCQNRTLYKALNKYGIENFTFTVIEETSNCEEQEKYYISLYDTYKNGYNETLGGDGKPRLQLNDEEVCTYYKSHTLKDTTKFFKVDRDSINKILKRNNIIKKTIAQANQFALGKKVKQLDLSTGDTIAIFVSSAEAEKSITGKDNHGGSVSRVCRGERKQYAGFGWAYVA